MKLTYKGKSAIITGACGGMGLETTKKLINNNINTLMSVSYTHLTLPTNREV